MRLAIQELMKFEMTDEEINQALETLTQTGETLNLRIRYEINIRFGGIYIQSNDIGAVFTRAVQVMDSYTIGVQS